MPSLHRRLAHRISKFSLIQATALLVVLPQMSFAGLPAAQAPTRGEGSSYMQTMQNYAFDGFTFLGLVLCAGCLIGVGRHAFGVYHEIHMGKAKWADLGATAVAGAAIIALTIFLATKATSVL